MQIPFEGGCNCGRVRYIANAEPYSVVFCHCLECQKNTGAPFSVEVIMPKPAVSVSGAMLEYASVADNQGTVVHLFCKTCGSPVLNQPLMYPDVISLKASSLDEPAHLQPRAHIWTIRKQPWLHLNDELPQYERDMT